MRTNIVFIADDAEKSRDSVVRLMNFIREFINDELKRSFRIVEDDNAFIIQNLYGDEIIIKALEPRCRQEYFPWVFWNAVEDDEDIRTDYKKIAKEIGFKESDWYERTIIDLGGVSQGTEQIALIKAVAVHNQDAPWMVYTDCEYDNFKLSTIAIEQQLKYHITNFALRNRQKPKNPAWKSRGETLDFGYLSCRIHNNTKSLWEYGNYVSFLLRIVDIFATVVVLPFHHESEKT